MVTRLEISREIRGSNPGPSRKISAISSPTAHPVDSAADGGAYSMDGMADRESLHSTDVVETLKALMLQFYSARQ